MSINQLIKTVRDLQKRVAELEQQAAKRSEDGKEKQTYRRRNPKPN